MRRDLEDRELLKADTYKPLPTDLQEMSPMNCSQSPFKGDLSLSMPIDLVTVKQEPWEMQGEASENDALPDKYISTGVQFAGRLDMKKESSSNPSPRLCSRVKQEVGGECGETSASLPKSDRLPATPPVHHVPENHTRSHSSTEASEPKANAATAASASASSSLVAHILPPVSPLPSSTTPTPLTSEAAAEQTGGQQSLGTDPCTQQRSAKKANLDNIIHRLERAANREETLEWEF